MIRPYSLITIPQPVHKLNEPQQGNTNKNATHIHNGAHNSYPTLCHRCGKNHSASKCHFKTEDWHACGKVAHISRVCRKTLQKASVICIYIW